MKTKHLILPALLISGTFLLGSCKKKNEARPNTSITYHFEVNFNANTVDISKVDSVTISLKVGDQVILKKLQKGGNAYSIDHITLNNTPSGATVSVYTPKANNTQFNAARIFVYDINSTADTASHLVGPSDVKKDKWKPRAVVTDTLNHVQLTIGENQDDPFFSIKANNPSIWTSISLARDADTNTSGLRVYPSLFSNGSNMIINTTDFVPYTSSMINKSWYFGEVLLQMDQYNHPYVVNLYYAYQNRN